MKVVGYTRVSTEDQAREGLSLAAQAEKIRAYTSLYDLKLFDIVEDAAQSAKSLKRPGLQNVLDLLRSKQAQGLVVCKLDRLTRSVVDLGMLIQDYFGENCKHQSSLFSVSDQVNTRSASGLLILNVLMSVAQWERQAIGERTRDALAYKKSQGIKLGRRPVPLSTPKDLSTLNFIHSLKQAGASLRDIAAQLNARGVSLAGGKWYASTVRNYLQRGSFIAATQAAVQ